MVQLGRGDVKSRKVPGRGRVLQLLRERSMTAGELADQFDLSKPTMSAHFGVLREADLVSAEKKGTTITVLGSGSRRIKAGFGLTGAGEG